VIDASRFQTKATPVRERRGGLFRGDGGWTGVHALPAAPKLAAAAASAQARGELVARDVAARFAWHHSQ
jgi:hypothetical protein